MRRLPQQHKNFNVTRQRDERAFRQLLVLLAGGLMLAVGFSVAVWQHVAAMRCGYQNEALREERARLLAEQQQLQLALDEASAPGALERAARQLGMQPARAAQMSSAARTVAQNAVHPTAALVGAATVSAARR
jgi:tryptophan 2,3-dioxygenase